MSKLDAFFAEHDVCLLDGASGTQYFARGLEAGYPPELWNVEWPDRILDVHRHYVKAGSDLVLTNSFGGSALRLKLHKAEGRVFELNRAAALLGREAADEAGRIVLVAGSMGPTGELLQPVGALDPSECRDHFAAQAEGLVAGGVDLLWIETMSDLGEVEAAVAGVRSVCDLPIVATLSFDTVGRTMMGVTAPDVVERLAPLGLLAIGANCGNNLADTEAAVTTMRAFGPNLGVAVKANAGVPVWSGDGLVYDGSPEIMGSYAARMKAAGIKFIGGCCGSGPEHIGFMRDVLDGTRPDPCLAAPCREGGNEPSEPRAERVRRRGPRT